ncbi:MAG: fibronectin type III domain-containing protein, partial [Marmoricola sp.]
ITGIDGADAGLAKTGRLYLETIPRLTSGAEYADLGRVLTSTCDQFIASSTGGFTTADCEQVRAAVAATELSSPPTDPEAAAAEAPISCPTGGSVDTVIARDDDGFDGFGFSSSSILWGRTPDTFGPGSYTFSGTESLFGLNPDPEMGFPSSGAMTSAPFTVPATSGGTYLNFHHAYVMDWFDTTYYDGGELIVSKLVNDAWTPVAGLPWVNGPTRHILGSTASGFTGFGGDSHGYGSSQVDLSSLAGERVKVDFRVEGDADTAYYGWWIDDVRLYGCDTAVLPPAATVAPTAPTGATVSAAATSATVSWKAPTDRGSTAIASYRVTRSDGKVTSLPGTSHSAKLTGFDARHTQTVRIEAINGDALVGPPAVVGIYPTTTTVTSSTTRAKANRAFTLTARLVRRNTSTVVGAMPLVLQRKVSGWRYWHKVSTGTTSTHGTKAWSVRLTRSTYYRVVSRGAGSHFGSISASRLVRKR